MDRHKVMAENSRSRVAWDVLLLLLALVAGSLVTFELAFVHQPRAATSVVLYLIDAIFLAHVWVGLRTSYREMGVEVRDTQRIRARYLRRRLALVLLGAVPFDVIFFALDGNRLGISMVLWIRLSRLVRIEWVLGTLKRLERNAASNSAALRIVRLFVVAGVVLHFLACVWYLIPFIGGFPSDSWPVREGIVGVGVGSTYVLSLYWVVTAATTVGFGDVTPQNNEEYVFSIFVMLIGASLFAYVIATGASLISSLNLSKVAFWSRVDTVESYLRSRSVEASLSDEVRRYYEYLWDRHRGVSERSLLSDLPSPLRLRVMSELMGDLLPQVPLFRYSTPALRDELMLSLTPIITQPGGYLAMHGGIGDGIYFIADGSVEVVSSDEQTVHATLGAGEYFGDLTLMLGERRSASVRSVGFSEIFRLDTASFSRIRSEYPELIDILKRASQERSSTVAELVLDGVVL